MAPTVSERIQGYLIPGMFMLLSIAFHLKTAITSPSLVFSNNKAYRDRSFIALWVALAAPKLAADTPAAFASLLAQSRGTVLDVGPGAGNQVSRFSHPENIKMIYGAEPGKEMHAVLLERAAEAGLGGKYRVLNCGAEEESLVPALAKEGLLGEGERGLEEGVFDEIVCIRVLCGVPRPRETVAGLYRLLKPGGKFVLLEHVLNEAQQGNSVGGLLQRLYSAMGWSLLMGGCDLRRNTAAVLMEAAKADGGWETVQLETTSEWSTLPHVFGYCVKKRG